MEIGHIFGHNGVRREFHSKTSKTPLWWSAAKHFLKTKIPRLLTIFCKLVIISLVMGLNKNFKVRVPNCRFDESNRRTRWIRRLKGVWEYFVFVKSTCEYYVSNIFGVLTVNSLLNQFTTHKMASLENILTLLRVIVLCYSYSAYHQNDTFELLPWNCHLNTLWRKRWPILKILSLAS